MLPHQVWQARQAQEDLERGHLEAVFSAVPKGWSRRTPRPVWDKTDETCKYVFDGAGMRLIARCRPVDVPEEETPKKSLLEEVWGKREEQEQRQQMVLSMELVCLDGSSPDETRRRMFRESFFPEAGKDLVALHRSQTGVLTYQLLFSVE
jgi:hypothetical protein